VQSDLAELKDRRALERLDRSADFAARVRVSHRYELAARGVSEALDHHPGFQVSSVQPFEFDHVGKVDVFVVDEHLAALMAKAEGGQFGKQSHKVVVIADSCREVPVRQALASGVSGYLHIGCTASELLTCLRRVVDGGRYLCFAAAQNVALGAECTSLTRREVDVLCLLGEGRSNRVIASELGISVGTVKTHIRRIMSKLSARNRTEVVSVASRRGFRVHGDATRRSSGLAMPALETDETNIR